MDPAFFTVRTPRARTHQQQLACMHERTGMHEPACILAAAAGCRLLLAAAGAGSSSSSHQQQPASASKHDELLVRVFLSPPRARPLKT